MKWKCINYFFLKKERETFVNGHQSQLGDALYKHPSFLISVSILSPIYLFDQSFDSFYLFMNKRSN